VEGSEQQSGSGVSAPPPGDFPGSLAQLQSAVSAGCDSRGQWPDNFAAGVRAAFDFAVANPAAARTLTVSGHESGRTDPQLTHFFASELGRCMPPEYRPPAPSDGAVLASITSVVSDYLRWGRAEGLGEIVPHLMYLALLPYVGFSEAQRLAGTAQPA
jgi:hypothetical protein